MDRYANIRFLVRCLVIAILQIVGFNLMLVHAARSVEPSDLLQFTAAGHVLGFDNKGVYVASGDHMLRVKFVGTPGVKPVADQMPSGDGQARPMGRVTYPDMWPGISLSYYHRAEGIVESSYLLEPGADVGQIQLCYNASVEIEAGGCLLIKYETGQMRESAPVAWQDINGQRIPVEVAFCLLNSSSRNPVVGFSLGRYSPFYPLTIDPTLQWNTFMGSSSWDRGYAIVLDDQGNVYVSGESDASWGSPVNAYTGSNDTFVAKLNSSGSLLWNTFMGGAGDDRGYAIALDDNLNVYVAGRSSATWGSPVNSHTGDADGFAAKLNSSGVLQWNTFMGSSDYDYGHAIAVDASGNIYVTGHSNATWGSPVNAYAGNYDAFAVKLNNSGILQWNTFMGSLNYDHGNGIAVDGNGNVYVTGESDAAWGSPVNAYAGSWDAFAVKLNNSGILQWNTFMGSGSSWDEGYAISVDVSGNVYVVGMSVLTWSSPVNAHAGIADAFAAKLNSSGARQWHTFMGSSDYDYGYTIAVDGSGNVYVAGYSETTWGSPVNAHAGGSYPDAFATKLNSSGVRLWNTFMGSSGDDSAESIAVDGSGNACLVGYSDTTWGSPLNAHAGGYYDAFVAKLVPTISAIPTISEWGMIVFFILSVGAALWVIRRREKEGSV